MIEDSIQSGRYPLDQETEKQLAGLVQVINRSSSDDLTESDIRIEVRLQDLYVLNNYIQTIQHLPGVIEIDAIDSFKMLSRRAVIKYLVFRVEKYYFNPLRAYFANRNRTFSVLILFKDFIHIV